MACCFQSNHRTSVECAQVELCSKSSNWSVSLEAQIFPRDASKYQFDAIWYRFLSSVLVLRVYTYKSNVEASKPSSGNASGTADASRMRKLWIEAHPMHHRRIRRKHSSLWLVIVVLRRIRSSFIREKRIIQFEMIIWNNFRRIQMQTSALVNTPLWSSWIRK